MKTTAGVRATGLEIVLMAGLAACAAERKTAAEAPASPATQPADAPASQAGQAVPAQPGYPPPAPAKAADAAPTATAPLPSTVPAPTANATFAPPPPNRALALGQASKEIEASQRELDAAGGDCRNACRALGSMDRAAGRLCGLALSNDEVRRCGDAKTRVYSARDRVRHTCGSCPDVSVERDAPIPSR
jgi:hypothetical protein